MLPRIYCAKCDIPVEDAARGLVCPRCAIGVYLPANDYARPPSTILRDWISSGGDDDELDSDELVPAA